TRCYRDWSSDVCSSDLMPATFRCAGSGGGITVPVNSNHLTTIVVVFPSSTATTSNTLTISVSNTAGENGSQTVTMTRAEVSSHRSEERRVVQEDSDECT